MLDAALSDLAAAVGVNVTATAVITAANVADDARYNPATNVNGSPSPAALGNDTDDGGAVNTLVQVAVVLESFEWLHWWHGHYEARRVVDRSSGILLREGKREIGQVAAGSARKLRQEDHHQFLSVKRTCAALEGDQVFTPSIKGGKAKEIPSCPWWQSPLKVPDSVTLGNGYRYRVPIGT